MVNLVVLCGNDGLPEGALERVRGLVQPSIATTADDLRQTLPAAEIMLAWDFKTKALPETWHLARKLRWVHVAAAGVDAAMFPALRESEVVVTNARGIFDVAMAEYALGMMLYFGKRFDQALANQRRHQWEFHVSDMLQGATLVIVGLGSIGRSLAVRARALEMRVIGVTRSGAPDATADHVFPVRHLHEALRLGDYVAIFTPLTSETRGLFGAAELRAMKPGSVLINLGRGGVVDEEALIAVLHEGRLRVADDVFSQEPLPADSPLWDAPGMLLSPHCGGDDAGANDRLLDAWAENVRRFVRGEQLQSIVDKQRGY